MFAVTMFCPSEPAANGLLVLFGRYVVFLVLFGYLTAEILLYTLEPLLAFLPK